MVTMADKRDYYEILGVDRSATKEQISEAYRKLALKYHPDRNPGDETAIAKFKEAAEAFEVLNHPEKRAKYDRYGFQGLQGSDAPHFHDVGDIFEAFGDVFGEGLFGDLFGGGRGRGRRARKGGDVQCEVTLDLFEAANGASKVVEFDRHSACETCSGSGAKPGTRPEKCPYCGGSGRVVQASGFFSLQTPCPSCRGSGRVIREACPSCRGNGYVPRRVSRKVEIPAGRGQRHATPPQRRRRAEHLRRAAGRLLLRDPRQGTSALPSRGPRPGLPGADQLFAGRAWARRSRSPRSTVRSRSTCRRARSPATSSRLRGRGMPDVRYRGRGDLHVQITVEVPKRLSDRHEELLRELAEIENTEVSPKRKSFFEKIKDLFHAEENP